MEEPTTLVDKWGDTAMTQSVEFYHSAIRKLVAERLAQSGKTWEEAVVDPDLELRREDFERVEQQLLDTGYRFESSAQISVTESAEKYRPLPGLKDSGTHVPDEHGRIVVGAGDNVFHATDVEGTARFVSTVEIVMEMLVGGVPEGTIGVIDDSGGTLTAPILEGFAGVICMGGTIRAHLGILTREYGIPCLMAAELDGLGDGDRIRVEYSKKAADAYSVRDETARARIWKLP